MARRSEGTEDAAARGRIAAGDILLRFGSRHGAAAERLTASETPTPKPRPANPPAGPFPEVVDRIDEIERAGTALVATRPVLLHGPPGSGKSTLLRHLSRTAAHDAPDGAGAWPDGTVFLSARGTPPGDLLRVLHRALHHSDTPVRATELQIENGLRERQALVLIDDVELSAGEAGAMLETAAGCAFALGSETDLDGLQAVRVPLRGLPADAGIELVSRATGREPSPLEAARIREIHGGLGGRPLLLLQIAALLHTGTSDLEAIARTAGGEDAVGTLAERLERTLSEERLRTLLALEAVDPASLAASDVAAIAELDDPAATLEALAHRGLARVEGARYRAAGGLGALVAARHDREAWRRRALDHFALRAKEDPEAIRTGPERETLLWALERAIESERWGVAVDLARAVEADLALRARWDAWGEVLERAREAGRAADDPVAEAWALHQRGTRALALGELERAIHDLDRAVEIREAIGEDAAAAVSRRNLELARGVEATPTVVSVPRARRSRGLPWVLLAVALVLLGAIGLFALRADRDRTLSAVDAGSVR
ncbi:MAG: ATP-binding protein, partial [Gemmatimonadetes bacterium]|nr:ATP-binding protein [Gemmatimonadota bacterium]